MATQLLCVQLGAPAEVLMCTPALRALRAQCPGRRLTLLCSPAGAALGPHLPDIDAVLAYEAPWMRTGAAPSAEHLGWLAELAAQGFDGAVIFTGPGESALPAALLCQLAGIPLRAAYCRERPYGLLTHPLAAPEPGAMSRHGVQRRLDLVRGLGAESVDERLCFLPSAHDLASTRMRLGLAGIDPQGRWLAVHPGPSAMARRYPADYWAALMRRLSERVGCPLVLTGGGRDLAHIAAIKIPSDVHLLSLAGQLHVGELGALLAQASLLISHNPDSVQLACAAGTPVVDLSEPGDGQATAWRTPSRLPCQDVACPETQMTSEIVDAVCSLLKESERDHAHSGKRTWVPGSTNRKLALGITKT